MTKVIIESWRYGLQKVLEIEDEETAREFLEEAEKIGVNCKISE